MKHVFALLLLLFVSLYIVAETTLERAKDPEIIRLRWATDPNPARKVQSSLFAEMYPGLDVVVDPGLGGDQTKLIVQCATGTGPDIIDTYNQYQMWGLVQAGLLLDLTEYGTEMKFSPEYTFSTVRDALMVEGRQYRFPCNIDADGVIYNKAIFDDHGVPYPKKDWTYQDFIKTAQQIQNTPSKSGEKHLAVAHWSNMRFFQNLLIGHGGRFFSPDGLTSALDSEEGMAAMRFYDELIHVHKVLPTPAEATAMSSQGGWGSGGINWFSSGKAAMIFIGRWYTVQVGHFPEIQPHLGAVPIPRVGDRPPSGFVMCRSSGVNINSPHWREALSFIQYLASPEYSELIVNDGDAIPPNPNRAGKGEDLVNKIMDSPDFHQPFIDAIHNGHPFDISPFVDASVITRWLQERLDAVENDILAPEAAMKSLASEINRNIRTNISRRPDLRRKYEELTGRNHK
ncbi:extracellular solute-binding protein [Candidatus Poribacteria bacterium]|nr:extracellular solute-binding protein [Candidatus Poribacteria bacterium]